MQIRKESEFLLLTIQNLNKTALLPKPFTRK